MSISESFLIRERRKTKGTRLRRLFLLRSVDSQYRSIYEKTQGRIVSLDGKSLRRAHARSKGEVIKRE